LCYNKLMNPLIGRILIVVGIALALFVLVRGFLYAPNGEVDSGLSVSDTAQSASIGSVTQEQYPARLIIPKLDIDAKVQHVGVTRTGNMAAPNNFTDVSWYKHGTVPGFTGSAVMAGHVDNALGTPAVFIDLPKLEVGDEVIVVDKNGKRLRFQVIDKELYRYDQAPVKKIFNDASGVYLNLITCQGAWVPEAKSAENRLVIYTKLVE